jgi:hypothetical protein
MNEIIEHEQDAQIIRYLRQQLADDDKAQFEIRMLEEPELLERVQLLEALQGGLRADERALLDNPEEATRSNVVPFRRWIRQPLSLAASVLVAALGLNVLLDTQTRSVPAAVPVGALVLLDARRDTAIPAFSGAGPYLLQVDAGIGTDVDAMELTLREASGAALLQQDVKVDSDGWIRLLYTPALQGNYQLDLAWTDNAGASQALSYAFTVQNP